MCCTSHINQLASYARVLHVTNNDDDNTSLYGDLQVQDMGCLTLSWTPVQDMGFKEGLEQE